MKSCRKCGIVYRDDQDKCFLCGSASATPAKRSAIAPGELEEREKRAKPEKPASPAVPEANETSRSAKKTSSLAQYVLIFLFAQFVIGLAHKGLGALFLSLIVMGFFIAILSKPAAGESNNLNNTKRVLVILANMILVSIASMVAFFIVCTAILIGTTGHR